ncbi:NeuD/PglB/VioB family sugar acetyltransferase [Dyadobacter psychrotolerans]|uniref:Acetyltransferase n=1 Tax=Dyadobacter psychrotolerans TaxID=2541721 RepID=A0A4V2Z3G7_9BACT|nr:NeuD/PglB/VioB family sugar acetyltransferase [Dyadobacter psychrotolerans]TDE12428.1 acetyltransferase [Dyadobacter psychrotolerans]
MLLYGAGGHAKAILSCLLVDGEQVPAIFDDAPDRPEISGVTIHGKYSPSLFDTESLVIAIGDNKTRRLVSEKVSHTFGVVQHSSALIDPDVIINKGAVMLHGSIIQTGSVIGHHVIINTRVSVNHDCLVADFVHLAPGVIVCGNVNVGENTFIGAGSVVCPNITIGINCFIAAGTVITQHIPDGSIVRGNPGRIIRTI